MRVASVVMSAVVIALAGPIEAHAASALWVGTTTNPREGIAIGYAWNYKTREEATHAAERRCREYKPAPKAARQCRLIGSIERGCLSTAFDPKSDSPGMGWAVAKDRDDAISRALADCRTAAPASRRAMCRTEKTHCDGDPSEKK